MDVIAFNDDVTDVDADTELNALVVGDRFVADRHSPLNLDRALHRIDRTIEFGEDAVAGRADNAPRMFVDKGIYNFGADGP